MEDKDINVLNANRELIIKDLHGDVIICLHDQGVISSEEYKIIHSLNLQEARNSKFLDILTHKRDGLEPFMAALKEWYWWIEDKLRESLEKKWKGMIYSSNIPPMHRRNVSRKPLLAQVRTALKQLQKGHYVVLHGMSGCGKSSLAAEALHHDIFLDNFQGKVYWLNCCQDSSRPSEQSKEHHENQILALQVQLNDNICNEELVSNVGTVNVKKLNIQLAKRFQKSDYKDGLIVLDDVNSAEVIEALNVRCKTLVITHSLDVMKNQGNRFQAIKVNEGFTEEETLQHFAQCVGIPVEKLPEQARQIHMHGKGHPLIISLIGAQLAAHQEEATSNFASWDPYLNVLVSKKYENLKRWSNGFGSTDSLSLLPKTAKLCINSLSPELQAKYKDFALFVEDVNIDIKVLEILWDLPSPDVKEITNEFLNKSLIVRKYNAAKNSYVYGIHDLLLFHLKEVVKDECVNLHQNLIKRYMEVSKGNVALLPINDNYFFYYIGHHIAQANQNHLFAEWYFNLDFIERKLKVAGPGDLLLDYKRYSSHFTDGNFDSPKIVRKLSDFVKFVESAGMDVRRNNGPDIIQLALQEPHDSEVYKTALQAAQLRPHTTYLHFLLGQSNSRSGPHVIQTKGVVSSACFLKNNNLILGYESGVIQIVNQKLDNRVIRLYEGHNTVVSRLDVCETKNIFLSVSRKSVFVWKLPDLDSSVYCGDGDRTPSPSQRQTDFTYLFDNKPLEKKTSFMTFLSNDIVDWAIFSESGSKLAFCSRNSKVEVRDLNSDVIRSIRIYGTCCIFSENEDLLIIGCSNSYIFIHNIINNSAVKHVIDSYPILALFTLPANDGEMKFGALTRATLCVWVEVIHPAVQSVDHKTNNVPCLRDYNRGEAETYRCCTAASDGSAVAIATTSGKILICELNSGTVIREMNDSSCNIKYLAMDSTREHQLVACTDDTAIKMWTLGELQSGKPASMKKNFVVAWDDTNTFVLASPTYKNYVKKVTGIAQFEEDLQILVNCEVDICAISKCSKVIAASTSDREVYLHLAGSESKMKKIYTVPAEEHIVMLKVEMLQDTVCIAIGCDRSLIVWMCDKDDLLKPESAAIFKKTLKERLVDCYLTSKELITVTLKGSVKKWYFNDEEEMLEVCQSRLDVLIRGTDLSSNCELVTLDSQRLFANIYKLENEGKEQKIKLCSWPTCCSFSVDGNRLAIGFQDGTIQLWDMNTLQLNPKEAIKMEAPIKSVCVSKTGLVGAATLRRVMIKPQGRKMGQARLQVGRVIMSHDDRTIITVDSEGHMHLIDIFNSAPNVPQLKLRLT